MAAPHDCGEFIECDEEMPDFDAMLSQLGEQMPAEISAQFT
jgi:hypothetical protein